MNTGINPTTQRSNYGRAVFALGLVSLLMSLFGTYNTLWSFFTPFITTSLTATQNSVASTLASYAWYALLGAVPFALVVISMGISRRRRGHWGIHSGTVMAIIGAFIAGLQIIGWLLLYTSPHVVKLTY